MARRYPQSVIHGQKKTESVKILEEIAKVLDIEADALRSVRENLTDAFEKAVEVIAGCNGQVCVTGIGKSGIIGAKIAATLRSTGTPAVFLHASEAMHGDVGMVGPRDVVLAIGKSGESQELNALLRILKRNGNVIISITSSSRSAMAELSDIVLCLPIPREACPLNLAPTASTTAALAVGDAIAVTLMKLKNISVDQFAMHHPGGQIGRRLTLTVDDIMRKGDQNPVISVAAPVKDMLVQITAFRVGAISVTNESGHLLGLVTDYDIRKVLESGRNILELSIAEVMNKKPLTVSDQDKAFEVLELLRSQKKPIAVVPVIASDRRAIGMVHLHDLISAGL